MAKIYYDSDASLDVLAGKTVAILGYGSQGHAHALNLRDSGINVIVGLHPGSKSKEKALRDGFEVYEPSEAVKRADIIMFLTPDTVQPQLYKECVEPYLNPSKDLGLCPRL
jgi:ketol-acid reductoisomerase (EC 1.1.1.86)